MAIGIGRRLNSMSTRCKTSVASRGAERHFGKTLNFTQEIAKRTDLASLQDTRRGAGHLRRGTKEGRAKACIECCSLCSFSSVPGKKDFEDCGFGWQCFLAKSPSLGVATRPTVVSNQQRVEGSELSGSWVPFYHTRTA